MFHTPIPSPLSYWSPVCALPQLRIWKYHICQKTLPPLVTFCSVMCLRFDIPPWGARTPAVGYSSLSWWGAAGWDEWGTTQTGRPALWHSQTLWLSNSWISAWSRWHHPGCSGWPSPSGWGFPGASCGCSACSPRAGRDGEGQRRSSGWEGERASSWERLEWEGVPP